MTEPSALSIILSIVNDQHPPSLMHCLSSDRELYNSVLKLARKNGLYYYSINKLIENGIRISPQENIAWEIENKRLSEFKGSLRLLQELSSVHNIDSVIIKACNTIPHVPRDIDFFVRAEERKSVIDLLKEHGMKVVHDSITETSLLNGSIKVDIYTQICYMGMDFFDCDFLLNSSTKEGMFNIEYKSLNANASFLLMLVHSLFGHRCMTLLDFLHIGNIIDKIDLAYCEKYADSNGWKGVLDLMLDNLSNLQRDILSENKITNFPYLYDRTFVLQCVSALQDYRLDRFNKFLLNCTLTQDRLIYELIDTPIYNFIKSNENLRNGVNSFTSLSKSMRGDKKSANIKKL